MKSLFIFIDKKLWWADQNLAQLGTCSKRDGRNPTVLRNKTSGVVHMKVYDKEAQQGKSHGNEFLLPFEYIIIHIIFLSTTDVSYFPPNKKKGGGKEANTA